MKTYLTYALVLAIAGSLLTFGLFFLGYHSDPEKVATAQWIGIIAMVILTFVIVYLGTKARAATIPPEERFGYGRALGAGVMIVLFASLFGVLTNYAYFQFINPGFVDVLVQAKSSKLEATGVSATQLDQMEQGIRMMMKPPIIAVFGFFQGMLSGTLIALITSAFARRST